MTLIDDGDGDDDDDDDDYDGGDDNGGDGDGVKLHWKYSKFGLNLPAS